MADNIEKADTGSYSPMERGSYVHTQSTKRTMRCFAVMEHELTSVARWGREFRFFLSLAVFCFGYGADWAIEYFGNENEDALRWIMACVIAGAVSTIMAFRTRSDIKTLADTIKTQSTDIEDVDGQ